MKPYAICHMVTTIDGKILADRWGTPAERKKGVSLFESTAAPFGVGAWIVGTTTMKEFCHKPFPLPKKHEPVPAGDYIARPTARTLAIGLDRRGQTFWQSDEVEGDHVVLILTEQVTTRYRAHLRAAGCSYLICGKSEIDLKLAMTKLTKAFKLKKVMIQGGGNANGSFLAAGLVDEVSQVILPIVDGGVGVAGFFDIDPAPAKAAARLRLMRHRTLPGGVHWFRYRVL